MLLDEVKVLLGVTGTYQNNTIQGYIDEVKQYLIDGGVSEENITAGIVARGVSDLWNYGDGKFSDYFLQRASQLVYKRVQ